MSLHASKNEVLGFDGVVHFLTEEFDTAVDYLRTYFGRFEPRTRGTEPVGFTGRFFEHAIESSNHDRFCPADFLAPALLSAPLRPATIATLMSIESELNGLLNDEQCPKWDIRLWDASHEQLADDSALGRLYSTLRGVRYIGPTHASKLLAAKRPHLVPIRDDRVWRLLGCPKQWWIAWRNLVSDEKLISRTETVIQTAGQMVPTNLTVLRCLDIVLWREATARGF